MSGRLPLAVLGAGAEGLRQARVAAAHPGTELTAVIDPAGEGLARAEELGFPVAAEPADAPPSTCAAIVAVPHAARLPLIEEAAARGWALLLDGALAHTLRDGRRVLSIVEAAGIPLLVGHHRRHHACVAAAKEAVQGGLLGRRISADAVWLQRRPPQERSYAWRVASGAGPALTRLLQDLDLMRWLMGEIAEVVALTGRPARHAAADDSVAAALRFADGGLGAATVSEAALSPWGWEAATGETDVFAHSGQDVLRITGAEGALSLPSLSYWRHGGPGAGDWSQALSRLPLPCPPTDPFEAQLAHFIRVAAGDEAPLVSGDDALRSLASALAVEESARTGRALAPDPDRPGAWEPTADAIYRNLAGSDRAE